MQPQKFLERHKLFVSVGFILTLGGTLMVILNPILFNHIINSELVLKPDKKTYEIWQKTPIHLTLKFYFFNWTNPEDLFNNSVKPHLEQIGPYCFTETKEKVDIVWNDNGTVSFRQLRRWYFDEDLTSGSLDDQVTTINPIVVSAAFQGRTMNYVMQKGLSFALSGLIKDIHVTKRVGDMLFDGYEDALLNVAKTMPSMAGVDLPPFDKFGWFYTRNGSTDFDGLFNMGTGVAELPLGVVDRWNNKHETNYYEAQCAHIAGSAGEFWPQNISPDTTSLWSPDLCREIIFQYETDEQVHGLHGYKFIVGNQTMDNGTIYPENVCYCNGECVPSGVMNVSSCRHGAPGFVSFPHFYGADQFYLNQFEGLFPDKHIHEFSMTLEPRTGLPLHVAARFQINLLMEPNEYITLFHDVPRLFFPMLWFEQEVTISEELALGLGQLLSLPLIGKIIAISVLVTGLSMLLLLCGLYIYQCVRNVLKRKESRNVKRIYLSKELVPLNDSSSNVTFNSNKI